MERLDFRTYRRRDVTRKSGFKASGETTGGECKIKLSKQISFTNSVKLVFKNNNVTAPQLFKRKMGAVAFGMYAMCWLGGSYKITISCEVNGKKYKKSTEKVDMLNAKWDNLGCHLFFPLTSKQIKVKNLTAEVIFESQYAGNNVIYLCCDDLDAISFDYYVKNDVYDIFQQKTNLSVPHIYYLSTDKEYLGYLTNSKELNISSGISVVLKSCNRCKRYLPINMDDEAYTLAFALHCKKRAPCTHHNFHDYNVIEKDKGAKRKEEKDGVVYSYFGHQLECKACKKFFVNAPLNPQRNAQQFKEDGLRRRAFEVLVDTLLKKNFIHFEFENRTKKQFTEYIYNKFDGKCFKCGKKLTLNEMNLDHTMPLAYLYRLDETATCLCDSHNSSKNDHFPSEYYSDDELIRLSKITGLSLDVLRSTSVNMEVVNLLIKPENTVWFFDVFLADKEYQKRRDGRLTADKIYAALVRVLPKNIDLVSIYKKQTKKYPKTITLE